MFNGGNGYGGNGGGRTLNRPDLPNNGGGSNGGNGGSYGGNDGNNHGAGCGCGCKKDGGLCKYSCTEPYSFGFLIYSL